MHFKSILSSTLILFLVSGCSFIEDVQKSEKYEKHLLIAVQTTSDETVEISKLVLDEARRVVKRYERLSLDRLVEDEFEIYYSGNAQNGRYAIEEFIPHISKVKSSQIAVAAFMKRISDYSITLKSNDHLIAILITDGSSDKNVIANLQTLTAEIPQTVTVIFAGINARYRNAYSSVLHPIRDRAYLVGQSTSEIQDLSSRL